MAETLSGKKLSEYYWLYGFYQAGTYLILISLGFFTRSFLKEKIWCLGFSIVCILFYGWTVYKNAVNIPYADDYAHILRFLNSYNETRNLSEKLKLIFYPRVGQRLIFLKIQTLICFKLSGTINFKLFSITVTLALGALIGILFIVFRQFIRHWLLMPVLAILMCQFQFYDSIFWASATVHIWLLLFVVTTYFFVIKNNIILSILFYVFACSCYPNALFSALPVIILFLMRRNYYAAILGLGIFIIIFILYSSAGITNPLNSSSGIIRILFFLFCFLGSFLSFGYSLVITGIAGAFLMTSAIKIKNRKNILAKLFMSFVIISGGLIAYFRFDNMAIALSPRYGIYSILFLICCYVLFLEGLKTETQKKILNYTFIIGIIYSLASSICFFPENQIRNQRQIMLMKEVIKNKRIDKKEALTNSDFDLLNSLGNGIYKPSL